MSILLVDTNVVSILFNQRHSLGEACIQAVGGHQLLISFMTRAELSLWPVANNWGMARRAALPWGCPLATTDFGDFAAVDGLDIVPI